MRVFSVQKVFRWGDICVCVCVCRVFIELLIDAHPWDPTPSSNQGEGGMIEPNIEAALKIYLAPSLHLP